MSTSKSNFGGGFQPFMSPKDLEREIKVRMAAQKMDAQLDTIGMGMGIQAKLIFSYYNELKKAGFTAEEALQLTNQFQSLWWFVSLMKRDNGKDNEDADGDDD